MSEEALANMNPTRKKVRPANSPHFEKALLEFILAKQDTDWLSDDLVLEKALREQLKIDENDLQLPNGWLRQLKERNKIRSCTLHGACASRH